MPDWDANAAGFVLAGGQSSRMGSDKALALFRGRSLMETALGILQDAGLAGRIAGARSVLSHFAPVLADTWRDVGPLGGVHAGLTASEAEWNLFLPVDMPLLPSELLGCLLQRTQRTGCPVTASTCQGRLQPFPVLLHRDVLPFLEQRLRLGQTAAHAAWRSIPAESGSELDCPAVENLVQAGQVCHPRGLPPCFWFASANFPADLARLEAITSGLPRMRSF